MKLTAVVVMTIGELDTCLIRNEYEAILSAFKCQGANLIIADPVSSTEEALQIQQKLSNSNHNLLLIIVLRGLSAPTIQAAAQMSNIPCLIWPIQGRFALPSSALAVGVLRESGIPVELLYAPPENPISMDRIQCFMKSAQAYSRIRQSRIGVIGCLFPNLVSCRYDPQIVSSRLGATLIPISFQELRESMQAIPPDRIERARQEILHSYKVNAENLKAMDSGIRLHLTLNKITQEQRIDGYATECWSGFPRELGLNPCMGFIENTYTIACEGDVMLCISLLITRYLSGISAYAGDLYDLDLEGNVTFIHCGAPASLALHPREVVLAESQLARERGFESITCRPQLDPGLVTLFRFYGRNCDQIHVALGQLTGCEQSPNLIVKVKLIGDRWDFLSQCFGNHYVLAPGDIRKELKLLCKWFGITIFET